MRGREGNGTKISENESKRNERCSLCRYGEGTGGKLKVQRDRDKLDVIEKGNKGTTGRRSGLDATKTRRKEKKKGERRKKQKERKGVPTIISSGEPTGCESGGSYYCVCVHVRLHSKQNREHTASAVGTKPLNEKTTLRTLRFLRGALTAQLKPRG